MEQAVAGFLICGALLALTALITPLRNLVAALPMPLANALLAGVLFKFIANAFPEIQAHPHLTLPMIGLFFILRLLSPLWAGLAALIFGLLLSSWLGLSGPMPGWVPTQLTFIAPDFHWPNALALGLPLYLVTMAGQNLPGMAALRTAGYDPDIRPIWALHWGDINWLCLHWIARTKFGSNYRHPLHRARCPPEQGPTLDDGAHIRGSLFGWRSALAGWWLILALCLPPDPNNRGCGP